MAYTAAEMREMADMHTLFEQEEQARHRFKENTVPIANMHRDTAAMLRQAAEAMDGGVWISHEMNDFLHGSGPLNGKWFGEIDQISEKPFSRKVMYWWRRLLPDSKASAALATPPAEG